MLTKEDEILSGQPKFFFGNEPLKLPRWLGYVLMAILFGWLGVWTVAMVWAFINRASELTVKHLLGALVVLCVWILVMEYRLIKRADWTMKLLIKHGEVVHAHLANLGDRVDWLVEDAKLSLNVVKAGDEVAEQRYEHSLAATRLILFEMEMRLVNEIRELRAEKGISKGLGED